MPEDAAAAATVAPAARAEEVREPITLNPRPVKRARHRHHDEDSQASSCVPPAVMPQDSKTAAMIALADRKAEARKALEMAIREMGTNPAQVEAAERERDMLLDVFGQPTDVQKGDALVRAAGEGNGPAVARLITYGVDLNAMGSGAPALEDTDLFCRTPLGAAIEGGHDGVLEQLLAAGADHEKESNRFKPLMVAACYSRPACLKRLLAADVDVNTQDSYGCTALHYVGRSSVDLLKTGLCARLLLDKGANKDVQDEDGITPLMRAAFNNHPGVVAMLLEEGADRELADNWGHTALRWAERRGNEQVAALL